MNAFNIILVTLFLADNSFYNAQYLMVEYENINLQNQNLVGVSKEFQDKLNTVHKSPQKFFLYYADGASFYKSIPRKSFTNNAGDTRKDERTVEHKREVFKDSELKVYRPKNAKGIYGYYRFPDINEEFYGYKESNFSKIDYKEETLTINKYLCKLVEISFKGAPNTVYKIWYTEDIPISAGPAGFNVFPGLVLRVESPQYIETAIKISNEAKLSDVEKINPQLPVYKEEDFDKKMKEVMEKRSKTTTEEIRL